jgi:hypothetical protein
MVAFSRRAWGIEASPLYLMCREERAAGYTAWLVHESGRYSKQLWSAWPSTKAVSSLEYLIATPTENHPVCEATGGWIAPAGGNPLVPVPPFAQARRVSHPTHEPKAQRE